MLFCSTALPLSLHYLSVPPPPRLPHGLLRGIRDDNVEPLMECPLLCFVNARSGGQIGSDLALHLSRTIGRVQVGTGAQAWVPHRARGCW